MLNKISVVITSGGNATRFGQNKMLIKLHGKPFIIHTVKNFQQAKNISEIIVLVKKEEVNKYKKIFEKEKLKVKLISAERERIMSVYKGVKAARGKYVITHDGNRPLTPVNLINRLIDEVLVHKAAITAVPPTATIKVHKNLFIEKSLPRSDTWIAQTPQGFERSILLGALEKAIKNEHFVSTDDSEMVTNFGHRVKIVPGDEINLKITYYQDIIIAKELLKFKNKNE